MIEVGPYSTSTDHRSCVLESFSSIPGLAFAGTLRNHGTELRGSCSSDSSASHSSCSAQYPLAFPALPAPEDPRQHPKLHLKSCCVSSCCSCGPSIPLSQSSEHGWKHLIKPANINTHSVHLGTAFASPALSPLRKAEDLGPSAPVILELSLKGHRGSVSGSKMRCQWQSHGPRLSCSNVSLCKCIYTTRKLTRQVNAHANSSVSMCRYRALHGWTTRHPTTPTAGAGPLSTSRLYGASGAAPGSSTCHACAAESLPVASLSGDWM